MRNTKTTTSTAKATKQTQRACLGECSTETWLASNATRPKTVVLTLERTKNGYTVQNATIMKRVNQYNAIPVEANVLAITKDLSKRGVTVR
jgi:hypothetical protein